MIIIVVVVVVINNNEVVSKERRRITGRQKRGLHCNKDIMVRKRKMKIRHQRRRI